MDLPPSTQLSEAPSNIFHNSDGSPIAVFAEAGHIPNRPALVRRLKRHGAMICIDPRGAQIILINSESASGLTLVREWGTDENKVVLDCTWVKKCFEENRVLLSDDDYGGCIVHDDGRPIEVDENQGSGDEVAKSLLPTPRDTPVEPLPLVQSVKPISRTQDVSSSFPDPTRTLSNFSNPGPSMTSDIPLPPPQQQPQAPMFNGMDMAAMAQFMQQFASAQMPQVPQMPLMMNPQAAMLQQMFQSGFSSFGPQQTMPNDPFWQAVRDTMMNKGIYPSQNQAPASHLSHAVYAPSLSESPLPEPVLPFPIPPATENMSASSAKTKEKQRLTSPSAKRRKTSGTTFHETVSKNNSTNGSSMGPPSEKKLFMTPSGRRFSFFVQVAGHNRFGLVTSIKKSGGSIVTSVPEADFVVLFPNSASRTDKSHEQFLRLAQEADLPAVSAKFVYDCLEQNEILDTEPYQFGPITKNKRKRTGSAVQSASPIEPESEDEEDELPAAVEPKGESENEAALDAKKKRIRLQKNAQRQKRRQRVKEEQSASMDMIPPMSSGEATAGPSTDNGKVQKRRGRLPANPTTLSILTSAAKLQGQASVGPKEPPSPTPPPEGNQVLLGMGFKFSSEENQFAIDYAKVLLERDHEASLSYVSNAIYKKLPHHTLKSWRTHLASMPGFDFDEWTKRAGIAFRKAQNIKQSPTTPAASLSAMDIATQEFNDLRPQSYSEPPPADCRLEPSPPVMTTISSPPVASAPVAVTPVFNNNANQNTSTLEDDLVVISKFFADGNDDQTETEDVIWARLTAMAPCKTEITWEEFYQRHSEEVQRRYQHLVESQPAGGQ